MSIPILRWLAAALVLLNLAYYWYASNVETPAPVAPTPVLGAQRLLLVSELPVFSELPGQQANTGVVESRSNTPDPTPSTVESNSPPGAGDTAGTDTLQCWELGPIDKGLQIDLAELFERFGMPMRSFQRDEVDATDYRVYLAVNELEQRADYQRQLDEAGVESYVIGGGELEGDISLGLFTSRERAEAVAKPLQERKLPVVIHTRQRRQDQTWLRINSGEVEALGWSADLANLTLWPRPAILSVNCDDDGLSASQ
ncbi:MAG: hypothetical protein O7F73_16770 [Gammaproteobacteria bacterium]|nr:hypothetical protein [Gammaproteobacteria bacterium]